MSCITKQHVGKYTYLYESTSFRNAEGKPRNRKTRIGKIDPQTGKAIYTEEYRKRMEAAGTPVQQDSTPSAADVAVARAVMDSSRRLGSFHLLRKVAEDIGMLPALRKAFPKRFAALFTLACFLVESQEPLMYSEQWQSQTEAFPLARISSQRVSELLSSLSMGERNAFYRHWMGQLKEGRCLALDITSISSYSQLIQGCEWGYNRDHENLPQVNLCMLFGEECRLPFYQSCYQGSLKDVSTLRATLDKATALAPGREIRAVMDKGFYSSRNIDEMLSPARPIHFLISVPFTSNLARQAVESEQGSIDRIGNTILAEGGAIRGVHRVRTWHTRKRHAKLHVHAYFNPMKAAKERNDLYGYVTELRQEAMRDPGQAGLADEFKKYLNVRKSSAAPEGYTVSVKEEAIEERLRTCGWMVLLSDSVDDPQEALGIYRGKDVVEKSFDRLKNTLGMNRLRVHSDERMENKLFLGFLALLLVSAMHQRMKDGGLYKRYTMHELLMKLGQLHVSHLNGNAILQPMTKEQRDIYLAMGVDPPVG